MRGDGVERLRPDERCHGDRRFGRIGQGSEERYQEDRPQARSGCSSRVVEGARLRRVERLREGAVVLTGTVPEGNQIGQAEEIAKGVPGVKSVSNKISLGTQGGGG
jgi:hypothetical protein